MSETSNQEHDDDDDDTYDDDDSMYMLITTLYCIVDIYIFQIVQFPKYQRHNLLHSIFMATHQLQQTHSSQATDLQLTPI